MSYCTNCGTKLENGGNFCPDCGSRRSAGSSPTRPAPVPDGRPPSVESLTGDPAFYSDDMGVRVTPTRFIDGSTTYAMANITTVRRRTRAPRRRPAILTALLGAVLVAAYPAQGFIQILALGAAVACLGVVWALLLKPVYSLTITSTAGETDAIPSKDSGRIDRVAAAINEALISRH